MYVSVYIYICMYLYKEVRKRSYIYININNMHKVYVKFNSHWFGGNTGFLSRGKMEIYSYIKICNYSWPLNNIGITDDGPSCKCKLV